MRKKKEKIKEKPQTLVSIINKCQNYNKRKNVQHSNFSATNMESHLYKVQQASCKNELLKVNTIKTMSNDAIT